MSKFETGEPMRYGSVPSTPMPETLKINDRVVANRAGFIVEGIVIEDHGDKVIVRHTRDGDWEYDRHMVQIVE